MTYSRRAMIETSLLAIEGAILSACAEFKTPTSDLKPLLYPTLVAKPAAPTKAVQVGLSTLYESGGQDALVYVPAGYKAGVAAPMLLMLASEGTTAQSAVSIFQPYADAAGLIIVGVEPFGATWDYLNNGSENYGPDVAFISYALTTAFQYCNIDATRISIGGFSDAAMYAFAMALTNGTLFSKGMIFGAAYTLPCEPVGKPSFFVANGTNDQVAPPSGGGYLIDDFLANHGYPVDYVVFDGGHEMPPALVAQAAAWLTAK